MPRYDFRCRECAETFEVSRPMSASGEAATCPAGHTDTVKLLPTVAVALGGRATAPVPAGRGGGGGGCCGGACGCG
ncbi:MAG TPA: zinc ribbon domain-containing protein [Pseudonocardia sp.]